MKSITLNDLLTIINVVVDDRNLRLLVEELHRYWIMQKGWHDQHCFHLDTKPIPVIGYKRDKHHRDFLGSAAFGKCASRNMEDCHKYSREANNCPCTTCPHQD